MVRAVIAMEIASTKTADAFSREAMVTPVVAAGLAVVLQAATVVGEHQPVESQVGLNFA